MHTLTASRLKNLTKRGLHGDGGGLYLQITAAGHKSWIFRYRVGSKLRNHGLGALHTVSLAEAREKAQACRQLRLQGIDPIEEQKRKRSVAALEAARAFTFQDCAEGYIAAHKAGWKNAKHAEQWTRSLEMFVYPHFGSLPVADIDVRLVLKAIEPIWATKSETASRVRGRIEAVLDWAKVRGYRSGENPAQWRGNLSHLLPAKQRISKVIHHAALPHAEMPRFWGELVKQPGMGAQALQLTILTACRTGEVLQATWDEFDFENGIWTIPAERMKGGAEHRVPLSSGAVSLLEKLQRERSSDYVFPGSKEGKPLSNMAMKMVLRRMGRDDLTVHGFRSTFRDWAADATDAPREVAEAALAHTLTSKVEAAYMRSDLFEKRRGLMKGWCTFYSAN
ncbi:integrase arm-type DNA-binding domain-containing protein [Magnetovibrio sp. PR-2]|uniref:tyrosine-type recombinase/integrase n=1 Tax=Magnetovibrio sp. PR-2 TaxID=3120356 RepID=UPI002FCE0195